MSLRYTAVAGMAEASTRDADASADRWRDKIELKLDNRQVFFLFFGSAVVACMLFVLGVMVGKRIESRGQAEAPALQDPLAVLDRARQPPAGVAAADSELAFPSTLIAAPKLKPVAVKAPPPKPLAPPKVVALMAVPAAPAAPAAPKPLVPAPAAAKPALLAIAVPRPEPRPEPRPVAAAPVPKPAIAASAPKPLIVAPTLKLPAPAVGKGKFTLQLSTFGTAETANAFADRYPGAFVIAGDVPGKGMAYRVRYGNFASFKEATAAKENFERSHNMIALVAVR